MLKYKYLVALNSLRIHSQFIAPHCVEMQTKVLCHLCWEINVHVLQKVHNDRYNGRFCHRKLMASLARKIHWNTLLVCIFCRSCFHAHLAHRRYLRNCILIYVAYFETETSILHYFGHYLGPIFTPVTGQKESDRKYFILNTGEIFNSTHHTNSGPIMECIYCGMWSYTITTPLFY